MNRLGGYLASFLTAATMLAASPQKANADGERGGRLFIGAGAGLEKVVAPAHFRKSFKRSISQGGTFGLIPRGYLGPVIEVRKSVALSKENPLTRLEALEINGGLEIGSLEAYAHNTIPYAGITGGLARVTLKTAEDIENGIVASIQKETAACLNFDLGVRQFFADGAAFFDAKIRVGRRYTSDDPIDTISGRVDLNIVLPKFRINFE